MLFISTNRNFHQLQILFIIMKNLIFPLKNTRDTTKIAKKISSLLKPKDAILLKGDIASGKTYFSQVVIKNLLNDKDLVVNSPTFILENVYKGPKFDISHIDLYRLTEKDFHRLEWERIKENVSLIEWPNQIPKIKDVLECILFIEISFEDKKRMLNISSFHSDWIKRLDELEKEMGKIKK